MTSNVISSWPKTLVRNLFCLDALRAYRLASRPSKRTDGRETGAWGVR
jgi:hypothetical protein